MRLRRRSLLGLALAGVLGAPLAARAAVDLGALARGASALPRVVGARASAVVEVPQGSVAPPRFVPIGTTREGSSLGVLELGTEGLLRLAAEQPELGVSWSPPLRLLLDRAAGLTGASSFRNATGLTGRGVVLGIVDTGFDPTHPDLRDELGRSRVLWWLDFSRERDGRHPDLEDALGCREDPADEELTPCSVLDGDDLEALLLDGDPSNDPRDYTGHGTHVASLAGGNGRAESPPRYVGVAPEASYIVARVARKSGGIYDTDVLRAVRFVFERAEDAGMPAVVNLSLGTDFGGHDGTTPVERGLESLVGPDHPGRAIVVAAGNSGGLYAGLDAGVPEPLGVHTELHVGADASALVPIITPPTSEGVTEGTVYVWLTLRPGDQLRLGLENRGGTLIEPVPPGGQVIHGGAGIEATIINGVTSPGSPIPAGSYAAAVIIDGRWSSSEVFGLRLEGPASARLWIEGEGRLAPSRSIGPLFPRAQREGTVNVPASSPGLIAVGATLNRTDWIDHTGETVSMPSFGALAEAPPDTAAFFSSAGPNALGVLKPDLVAPGANVIGAMAAGADPRTPSAGGLFDDDGLCEAFGFAPQCFVVDDDHAVTGGTSMSAPLVAGAIALLFERDPTLDQTAVRAYLQAGARRLRGVVLDPSQLGAGALDLDRTLQALTEGMALRTPGRGSELVLSESYAHPDPSWPLQGLVELRDDAGDIVDGFDPRRLTLEPRGATFAEPLTRLAPGLWRFAVAAPAGSGGRTLTLTLRYDGRSVTARSLPIAVDRALSSGAVSARGGCALAGGGRAGSTPSAWLALFGLALGLARRRRWRASPPVSTNGATVRDVSSVLRLYTDFVCPFCFIAEQSTVPRLLAELELELDWYGFELHPGTPPGGVPLSNLFPGTPLGPLHERTKRFGASFGVRDFQPPDWLSNSRMALAIAEYARDVGRLEPFRQAAMEAHWRHGKNLEDRGDLAAIATQAGLDPDRALAAATEPDVLDRVDARQAEAKKQGVRGIPTFAFGSERIVGCQPYEAVLAAALRGGAVRRG
jgi:MYXO-CTERM domain-containing protein